MFLKIFNLIEFNKEIISLQTPFCIYMLYENFNFYLNHKI
jgi:hypothetical protein